MAPIEDHGNSERAALAAARLGDVHPPDRQGLERLGRCCTLSASLALASGVSTTSPSTPAVRRPALRSVTRRTLKSVLARDRSINFCNRRTLFRSPAFDAVKIRCRNRRTSSSTRRQSTWRQSKGASSGPFTSDRGRRGVQLVLGFRGLRSSSSSQAHLTASARFRARAPGPVSGRLSETTSLEEAAIAVPVSRCLSAAGIRFSVIRFPPRNWALLAVGLPANDAGPRRGYRVPHARASDRGGCPLYPEDGGAHPGRSRLPDRRLPLSSGQSLHPATTSHPCGALLNEASTRVQAIHPSDLPLACGRPDGTGRPWAFPRASHPADQEPTTHAEVGTGHRARTWNYTLNITSGDPPIV